MRYLLGIDLGTSATKTVIFDEDGKVIASASIEYPMYQPKNGWAEQDPEDWWQAVCGTSKAVFEKSGISPDAIVAIGLSGQMHGLVMLNKAGEVIRRSIIWCDQRTGAECVEMTEKIGARRLIEITANPALTGFTASKILWVKNNEPEIYANCSHILLPKDYIRYKLTGVFASDMSDASGMQLLDVPNRCWSEEVLDRLGIDRALLGDLYESPELSGRVTSAASELTGLAVGTPVAGGAGDNAAAAVGMGVVREGRAFTTIGTSGVVFTHTDSPRIDPLGRVHTFCCAVPGAWHNMGVVQSAGHSLKWFRDTLCQDYIARGEAAGKDPYIFMDKAAAEVPVGSNSLIYLPYLMGERTPHLDADCRGVFFGLAAIHTKEDMLRAVMEGVSFALRDSLEILKGLGVTFSDMLVCGGGGKSPFWRQMIASVYNCPVSVTASSEGAALGAGILAGVCGGVYPSVAEACDRIISTKRDCTPDATDAERYNQFYEVYRSLYPMLKPAYTALSKL